MRAADVEDLIRSAVALSAGAHGNGQCKTVRRFERRINSARRVRAPPPPSTATAQPQTRRKNQRRNIAVRVSVVPAVPTTFPPPLPTVSAARDDRRLPSPLSALFATSLLTSYRGRIGATTAALQTIAKQNALTPVTAAPSATLTTAAITQGKAAREYDDAIARITSAARRIRDAKEIVVNAKRADVADDVARLNQRRSALSAAVSAAVAAAARAHFLRRTSDDAQNAITQIRARVDALTDETQYRIDKARERVRRHKERRAQTDISLSTTTPPPPPLTSPRDGDRFAVQQLKRSAAAVARHLAVEAEVSTTEAQTRTHSAVNVAAESVNEQIERQRAMVEAPPHQVADAVVLFIQRARGLVPV